MANKRPNPGDRIKMVDCWGSEWTGIVIDLLAVQFTFTSKAGVIRFCLYSDNWELI